MASQIGEDVLQALLKSGELISLNSEVIMDATTITAWQTVVEGYLGEHEVITVAEARDLFATSRKYALGLLEYLDGKGITRRVGDRRVLRGSSRS